MLKVSTARPFIGLMPYLLGRRFDNPSFTLALAEKDVSLALEAGRSLQVPMPVTAAAHQTYLRALANDLGEQSFLATLEALETAANTEVPQVEVEGVRDRLSTSLISTSSVVMIRACYACNPVRMRHRVII